MCKMYAKANEISEDLNIIYWLKTPRKLSTKWKQFKKIKIWKRKHDNQVTKKLINLVKKITEKKKCNQK